MATRWIDFTQLKRQVMIRDVLARYGLLEGLREKKPGHFVGPCPIHGGKSGSSFNVDTERNIFNCFSTCGGGNVLDLVMKIEDCSIREAGVKLADWFGLEFDRKVGPNGESQSEHPARAAPTEPPTPRTDPPANPPLKRELKNLNGDHPYLVDRGLTVPTIKTFGVGYCTRGIMRGRIAIPIHDEAGTLVAYAGRAATEELASSHGKYRLPDGFKKSYVLFNLHRAVAEAKGHLIMVEGFFDCFRVHQAGHPNVIALMGSTLSDEQEALLLARADRLDLMFDGDEAGITCLRQFYGRLRRRLFLREVHLEPGEQPDSLSEDRIRELLS